MEDEYCYQGKTKDFPNNFTKFPGFKHLLNPGNIENLHMKTRNIMPIWLEGVHVQFKPRIQPNILFICDWILSHGNPSGFRVGGQYNFKMSGNMKSTPMIKADINPSTFACNLSFLHYPMSNVRIEYSTQTDPYLTVNSSLECEKCFDRFLSLEYIGKSSTTSFKAYNAHIRSGRCTLAYLQSITSQMALGTEFLFEWNNEIYNSQTAFAFRYCNEIAGIAATFSKQALDVSYWRQVAHNTQFGSSLVINGNKHHSIGSIFYQWELKDTKIRGLLDSNWSIGFTYNRRINELNTNLGFSLLLCIPTNKFVCGFQYNLDFCK